MKEADGRDADIEALLAEAIAAKQDEEPRIDEESQKLIDERIDEAIAAEDAALLPVADVPIAANAQSGSANAAYAEGAGTEEDPFVLGSAYDLLLIADDVAAGVSAYYLLATDIDLSGSNGNLSEVQRTPSRAISTAQGTRSPISRSIRPGITRR